MRRPPRSSTCDRWSSCPGLVDLHAHLPQLPNAGLGSGLDLLTWLDRYIFPLERAYDRANGRADGAGGVPRLRRRGDDDGRRLRRDLARVDRRGLRRRRGARHPRRHRQGDDGPRSPTTPRSTPARSSRRACASRTSSRTRWHGRDDGRLRYAFTPRFAVSCSAEMLRESAALATRHGAYWQTHLSEDARRDRRGRAPLPGGAATTSMCTTGPAALGGAHDPGPRHPPVRRRGRAARRERRRRGALPGLEPVPLERDDAARRVPCAPACGSGSAATSPPAPSSRCSASCAPGR